MSSWRLAPNGSRRRRSPITGSERERLWAMLKESYPFFAEHEAKTSREIPVVALTRRAEG
jgi:F420H(2)-dependent quinone reductase